MAGGSMFGQILILNSVSATIVFIAVLVFFLFFEALLHVFEVACNKRGFKGLVKKLYREFMMMGLISFAIYIASEAYDFPQDQWFNSFHFAHIVIVFIGITFLLQSALLVSLVSSRNLTLLRHASATCEELILDFVAMHKEGGLRMFLFDHGPISIPFPELREKIEYKILQQFFIKVYNLPHEFKFANYMCLVLKNYVIALVEVRPVSWLIMTCFTALNYLKIAVVDPIYQREVCKRYPGADIIAAHSIHLSGGSEGGGSNTYYYSHAAEVEKYGEQVCDEYTLRYTFVVLMMIGLYLLGVLIASEVYMKRLIEIVLDQQALEDEAAAAAATTEDNTLANSGGEGAPLFRQGSGGSRHKRRSTLRFAPDGQLVGDVEMALHPHSRESEDRRSPTSGSPTPMVPGDEQREDGDLIDAAGVGIDWDEEENENEEFEMPMIKDRRNQYLDSLERLMAIEYDHHMDIARRMSTGEGDFSTREAMAAAVASMAEDPPRNRNSRSLTLTGKVLGLAGIGGSSNNLSAAAAASSTDAHGARRGSHLNSYDAPTGETLRAKFQRMQTVNKELQEMRHSIDSATAEKTLTRKRSGTMLVPSANRNRSATNAAEGRKRSDTKFFFISLPSREHRSSAGEDALNASVTGASKSGGRARGYSVEYFDMNVSSSPVAPPFVTEQPQDLMSKILRAFKCIGAALHKGAKKFGSMLIEHHIGKSKHEMSTDEDVKLLKKQFNRIFLFAQPEFYYHSVEMALLVQCVYIALWATNFVSMAQNSHFPVRWHILLVIPLPINFFLLKQIIFTSCMLKSILSLDKYVADKICEDAVDEQNVTERLRKLIRIELKKTDPEFDKESAKVYLKEKFEQFCNHRDNGIVGVNEKHLKLYLHSLHIFLTDISIARIFTVIDFDRDGIVTWENLCRIVFPDLQQSNVKVSKRSSVRYVKRMSFDVEKVDAGPPRLSRASIVEHPTAPRRESTILSAVAGTRRPTFDAAEEKGEEEEGGMVMTVNVARDSLLASRRDSHTKQLMQQQQHHTPFANPTVNSNDNSRGSSRTNSPTPSMQRMVTTDSINTAVTAPQEQQLVQEEVQEEVLYMTEEEEAERFGGRKSMFESDDDEENDEDDWAFREPSPVDQQLQQSSSGVASASVGRKTTDDFVDI